MSDQDQPAFSALRVAEQLTSRQLEYITEFSDQLESVIYLSRALKGSPPSLEQAVEIVAAAPEVLRKKRRRRQGRDRTKDNKAWLAELSTELVDPEDKEGDRLPAVLSLGEILDLFKASRPRMRDHLIFRIFYSTGVRIKELAHLLVGDLYLDELKIFVRKGKGDKDRYVPTDPETAKLIGQFTRGLPPTDRVIGIGERQIARVVESYGIELGITERYASIGRNFAPHAFRHTCATHLYDSGMDIYIIRDLLGHSSLGVTREYIHVGINSYRKSYMAHHPLCRPQKEEEDSLT